MRTLLTLAFSLFILNGSSQSFTLLDPAFVSAANQPVGGGGGPDVWYWYAGLGDDGYTSTATTAWDPSNYSYGSAVTVAVAGDCTKLAVRGAGYPDAVNVKLALYDGSGNRLSAATADVVNAGTTPGWWEVTLATPVVVTATTYYVRMSTEDTGFELSYFDGGSGVGTAVTYAAFPTDPLALTADPGYTYGVKMYVD